MSIQKIQHSNDKNTTGYYLAGVGAVASAGHESYKTTSAIKSEINGFKTTLRYLQDNSPFKDKETGIQINYKDIAPEIKEMKENRRTLIKEIKKSYPKKLFAKTIIGAVVGFSLGKIITIIKDRTV